MASAEFLKTVYEYGIGEKRAGCPDSVDALRSNLPGPDGLIPRGRERTLARTINGALQCLSEAGASRFVICCMTIHHLLPSLPVHLSARVVSLLDVIFSNLKSPRDTC
jgi:aspartate racemase